MPPPAPSGVTLTMSVESRGRLEVMERRLDDLTPVLQEIGKLMVTRTREGFSLQRRGQDRWPPRAVPNIAGIIQDLSAGSAVKPRRFTGRPALVDTGQLRDSIGFSILDGRTLELRASAPYAAKHQEGGTSEIQVTKQAKEGLTKLLRQRPELAPQLRWLAVRDRVQIRVPQREFLKVTPQDMRDAESLMANFLTKE